MELNRKKVFITGASQGIGKAIVNELAKYDCEFFLASRNNDALKELHTELNKIGIKSYYSICDVTKLEDVQDAVNQAIIKMGQIDLAILNAGVGGSNFFKNFDDIRFKNTFQVNVFGMIHGLETIIPIMLKQGFGTIAGVTSIADSRSITASGPYNASKIAASYLLESARLELLNAGIKIVTIRPGFVRTNLTAKVAFRMPFLMYPEKAARYISKGLIKNKRVISFPLILSILAKIWKIIPTCIHDRFAAGFKIDKKE